MLARRLRASQAVAAGQRRGFIKGMFGKKDGAEGASSDAKGKEGVPPGMEGMFPPGMGSMGPKMMKEFMKKSPDQQVEMMRQALEMQKKFGGSLPGLGKLNEKNTAFMEGMINNLEAKTKANAAASSPAAGTKAPSTTTASASSSSASAASSANKGGFRSPTGPTLEELRKINLGAEIEELFAELGSMREKRNHYRAELERREGQLATAEKEATEAKAKAADLRSRLGASENTVRIMNTETVALKASAQTLKAVQDENRRLTAKVSALQTNDTVPLRQRIAALEAELGQAQDGARALQRKLDRMRRRDLVAQFSHLLNDIRATAASSSPSASSSTAAASESAASAAAADDSALAPTTEREAARHAELFSAVQASYDGAAHEAWSQCGPAAAASLVAACEQFILRAVGRSNGRLDAIVELPQGAAGTEAEAALRAVAKERGYTVAKAADAGSVVVALPADAATPALLGPYGVLAAFAAARPAALPLAAVKPFISEALSRNAKRVAVSTSTTRSSGPGGQAANTAETQVSMTFSLDEERLFVSEAQDTRSQVANKNLAESRLFEERLALHNKKLASASRGEVAALLAGGLSSSAEGRTVDADRWGDATTALASAIDSLSASDRAIVDCARKAITGEV